MVRYSLTKSSSPQPAGLGPVPPVRSAVAFTFEIKFTINALCLNYPKTIPHSKSVEKLSSTKPVPGAKNVRDRWFNGWGAYMSEAGSCSDTSRCSAKWQTKHGGRLALGARGGSQLKEEMTSHWLTGLPGKPTEEHLLTTPFMSQQGGDTVKSESRSVVSDSL